jgi:S1-C subfamily serine protease
VNAVKRVVPELIEKGYYPHPWLGFEGYAIGPALARGLDLPVERGILIARVNQGGPADRAGLRGADRRVRVGNYVILAGGDIVTAVAGLPVDSMEDLMVYLETKTQVGDELTLSVWHGSERGSATAIVGERPS